MQNEVSQVVEVDYRHGGPYDRGAADAYYWRPFDPHYYVEDTYSSERIDLLVPETADYKAYKQGFDAAIAAGDFKDWG
jgi:hypothetical protein